MRQAAPPTGHRTPRLDHLAPEAAARVCLTLSCTDSDRLAKVADAGDVIDRDGTSVQVMHNGVLVEEGCYCGPWMTEIIYGLRGHHEPQEELVFATLLERLGNAKGATTGAGAEMPPPTMIEFGSYWTYYGIWFATALAGARVVAMEPDPAYLEVGRRNVTLNAVSDQITFVHAAIGGHPGELLSFAADSDGQVHEVEQHDLASLMAATALDHVDLALVDAQGAETVLLERARGELTSGRVRLLIVSTHHHEISGDPLTHQRALTLLRECGAHVIAEHTPAESFSGDGLIAVSFDERDADLTVELSRARSGDSLFGALEWDLSAAWQRASAAEAEVRRLTAELAAARARPDAPRSATSIGQRAADAEAELDRLHSTKLFRWSRAPRALYRRLRTSR